MAGVSKSLTGEGRVQRLSVVRLLVYTMSTMVFGMICSALGPSIPWLASNAKVSPETLGWLPAAQAVMCILSGLASSLMAYVDRKYHHLLLCILLVWLGGFFMLLPVASTSIVALSMAFGLQVLPRPWIGQMTNLLVSELFEEPSLSSAAQSFNQGGFAVGCVLMVVLQEVSSSTFGGEAVFYVAGAITGVSSLLFLSLPRAPGTPPAPRSEPKGGLPSGFTLSCAGLGMMAVGLEVACGTWLITCMTQSGFEPSVASLLNIVFWLLFAVSRLILAPCICKFLKPSASCMVIAGAILAALGCGVATAWPSLATTLLGVACVALGGGPTYAMTISMAKERRALSSVDSAAFAIASSLGAGGVPFVVSRVLDLFGSGAFFPSLLAMSLMLACFTLALASTQNEVEEVKEEVEDDLESTVASTHDTTNVVPSMMWSYWEQGWHTAPLLCQACVRSWELQNPDLCLQKISKEDLPRLVPELSSQPRFWQLPAMHRADLLRLCLLEKFGGVWVDATLFCTAPVMPWLCRLQDTQAAEEREGFFFVFERDSKNWPYDPFLECQLPVSNWFIASTAGHPLTRQWFRAVYEQLITAGEPTVRYFQMHDSFREMLQDEQMMTFYRRMPKVSARFPHILEFELGFATEAALGEAQLSEALEMAPMQKLTHKILPNDFFLALLSPHSESLLGRLCGQTGGEAWPRAELLRFEEQRKSEVHASWQLVVPLAQAVTAVSP